MYCYLIFTWFQPQKSIISQALLQDVLLHSGNTQNQIITVWKCFLASFTILIIILIIQVDFPSIRSLPHNQQFTGSESTSEAQKQLNEVSGSPLKLEESSCPPQLLKNIFVQMETIKSSMFPKAETTFTTSPIDLFTAICYTFALWISCLNVYCFLVCL